MEFHQHLIDDRVGVGHACDSHEVGHDVDRDGEHDGGVVLSRNTVQRL